MLERIRAFFAFATTRSGRSIAALEDENRKLREQLVQRVMEETLVTEMSLSDGITMGFRGGAARILVETFAEQFEQSGAVNYLEMTFISRSTLPGECFLVTLQRVSGKTPHQLRMESEAKLSAIQGRESIAAPGLPLYAQMSDETPCGT
ncbi:MAG: hypothetical protein A2286_10520 [Gammaproteobacteria bacterium RIFOXYA12_FULL_61_12]|nr:MAG: hypothetical protein A2514_10150 [Gammaproteobacteria bacterium RIFOXYD12_FULL_61_37]OGT89762.1 MAG: hypothetical protein A2286_10520 [Gammaproteobacteria bacterium RIFOXYA12_FULL_61_12]